MRLDVIRRVAKKELRLFFASPIGYLFLLAFLAVTLFVFFWVDAFFARNIADVRPMFESMPVLLIFLSAALTMRMWSEERRTGTLEFVATLPVSGWEFVLGKFFACWILLGVALLLTLPLPITVSFIAQLDWGPVWAGYLAAMLMGGAYLAMGLFVSARTDSQIVSLILASFVAGVFYLAGSPLLTNLVSGGWADVLRGIGTGTRFESITRGVLDIRDLYYYISLLLVFLTLNVYALEVQRWSAERARPRHRGWVLGTMLVVANLLAANVWLSQLTSLRVDVTQGNIYSISDATRNYLAQLQEPLLIRGYFSSQTHPLLAPLVPQMRDLLKEYAIAGGDKVKVEIIDPAEHPKLEEEANSRYGIRPVPFQVANRYKSSLVNSYFNVLVKYGDQYQVLGFRDLIEVKVKGETDLDVQLRNPEYDITSAIKKVLYGFQSGGDMFSNITKPVKFTGYISANDVLPPALVKYRSVLKGVLGDLSKQGGSKFSAQIVDPQAGNGSVADEIEKKYGMRPMATSLFSQPFYFYLTLSDGNTLMQVPLPDALSAEATKRAIQEAMKRFAAGVLKTVALMAPQAPPPMMGMRQPPGNSYSKLREFLQQDYHVVDTDLKDGKVPEQAEMLMVVDPHNLNQRQVFAIDQFLMKGGTVAVATGRYSTTYSQQSITASPQKSGLEDWLEHEGVKVENGMVMDPQNASLPAPVTRQVGGFSFQELVMLDYPYFIDVRPPGLNQDLSITSGLPQVTMAWTSPLQSDLKKDSGRTVTRLLESSPDSWVSDSPDVMPRLTRSGVSGFKPSGKQGRRTLALMEEGRFDSYFAGKPSPLLEQPESAQSDTKGDAKKDGGAGANGESSAAEDVSTEDKLGVVSSVIDRSPESARLFVFGSNDFLADNVLALIGSAEGALYGNSIQLMANAVDYSMEDRNLLQIRSRGHFNRTLPPMKPQREVGVESVNYGLALGGVGLVFLLHRRRVKQDENRYRSWLAEGAA